MPSTSEPSQFGERKQLSLSNSHIDMGGKNTDKKRAVEHMSVEDLERYILAHFDKPKDFCRLEIKNVFGSSVRVNVITSSFTKDHIIPIFHRPQSYFVTEQEGNYTFSPELTHTSR